MCCAGNYQWTPLVLALQALACYLPFLFWLTMQQRSGINLRSVVESVTRASLTPDEQEHKKHVDFAARSLQECLLLQRGYRYTCCSEVRRCFSLAIPCLPAKRLGNLLTVSYLALKITFVLLPVAQIAFMSHFTGATLTSTLLSRTRYGSVSVVCFFSGQSSSSVRVHTSDFWVTEITFILNLCLSILLVVCQMSMNNNVIECQRIQLTSHSEEIECLDARV